MIFSGLTEKMNQALHSFRNKGKLSEADVKAGMREIKLALLEADVNFKVVKDFIKIVEARAIGSEVMESLVPSQQVIKIVNEELTALMGGSCERLAFANHPPTVVMVVGLQGSGKTTHCAKLANLFKKQGKRPLLVACDVYRPAAIKQLQVLGAQINVPVYTCETSNDPIMIAQQGVAHAKKHGHDIVFLDTAGRLHVDQPLMQELQTIQKTVSPQEILLVVDAMTGQDAVNVASSFHQALDITGVVLTKLDGDTRGGAALSIRHVTGKPIKFIGVGEKMDAIEPFYPDRMASRILGMGDVLSLIEKAEASFDEKKAHELEEKLRRSQFTLNDFLEQFRSVKNIGNLDQMLSMLPGIKPAQLKDVSIDERQLARTEAIMLSMTEQEREHPEIISASRRRRIAAGCGQKVEDVNRLLKQYEQTRTLMKQFSGGKKKFGKKGKFRFPAI